MEGNFEVYQDGQAVGTAALSREGLYYRVRCRCRPLTEAVTRLLWRSDSGVTSLGILVPMGGCFGLDTRVAVKKCPGEKPELILVENGREALIPRPQLPKMENVPETVTQEQSHETERVVPIREDAPFEALEELKYAVLSQQDGQPAALIATPEEAAAEGIITENQCPDE